MNVGIGCQNLAMYVTLLAVPIILERQPGGPGRQLQEWLAKWSSTAH